MFEQFSEKLQGVFKKLRGQSRLREEHVDEALREIRLALLEADVQFQVARDFVQRVRTKAVGKEILGSLTAAQQVIQVTRDELVSLLGSSERPLDLSKGWPSVLLMVGLQGSGKTTSSAKLARDVYRFPRPASGGGGARSGARLRIRCRGRPVAWLAASRGYDVLTSTATKSTTN
jgi:signal recognition particle subunit SRP54